MQELELIEGVKKRLGLYMDFRLEDSADGTKAGPLLRTRLSRIPFNEASFEILVQHATKTLRQDFEAAKTNSGAIDNEKLAAALTHATCDPLRKPLFVMALMLGKNPDEKTLAALDDEQKDLAVSALFGLLDNLQDITENYSLLLAAQGRGGASFDRLDETLREFREELIPALESAAPAFAKKLGYDDAAIDVLKEKKRAERNDGQEHLHRLSPAQWQNALNPPRL